jgi:NSS family neurotransmitter:Na+ symporter
VFILAATGSAVGLGNIWKFPYITGENGGGAFVLVYLACIAVIGIPIMMAEVMLGRRGRQSPINTMRALAREGRHSRFWHTIGWMGVIAGFLILSYYSVVAGWALAYVFRAGSGMFEGRSGEEVAAIFDGFVASPEALLAWHTIFTVMTMVVVSRGVQGGLEKAVRFLMPLLLVILVALVGYSMNSGAFDRGAAFLFEPNFDQLTGKGVLIAMGHSFFTLSLGMGAIMVYGSYLPSSASIPGTTFIIAIADTAVALMAGLAIFPIVFATGLEPGAGPGLIFQTLPVAFGQMPGGTFFGALFFVLLVFAAWTSAISLIEPLVAWLVENRGWNRVTAAVAAGALSWTVGLGTVVSFNIGAEATWFFGMTFFDFMDFLTSNIMLPLGGLFIAVFASWVMRRAVSRDELELSGRAYMTWYYLVRYVTPLGVIVVFLNAVGLL